MAYKEKDIRPYVKLIVEEEGFLYEPKKTPDVSLFYSTIGRE
mgnify:CR=1 FL=1